jgi:hypothetical protein
MSRSSICTWRTDQTLAEELRRDVRHLMRFIQNHRLGARQQIAEALVLERQIREQQVMIHDHDVGGLGARRASNTWQRENCGHSWPRQFSRVEVIIGHTGTAPAGR